MKRRYLGILVLLFSASVQSQTTEQEARAFCEDAAMLMQLDGDKAAAYITECIKAKLEEDAGD